tara:strand:+ start:57649 stop:58386 length:738 start_codon:yes stop_codon:yes gene_type:complete
MPKNNSRFTVPAKKTASGTAKHDKLTVIIPVAGMGHRMKSYGPKCLFPTSKNRTIIERLIGNVKKVFPYSEIIVVVGFEANKIISTLPSHVRVVENQLYEETNIVESLRLALNNSVHDNILIIHGDLIFNVYTLHGITSDSSCAIVDTKDRFGKNEIGVNIFENKITNFSYGLQNKWAQIIYLTGHELEIFKSLCSERDKNKMYMFEILNMVIDKNGLIEAREPKGMQILEVDSLKDLPNWGKSV